MASRQRPRTAGAGAARAQASAGRWRLRPAAGLRADSTSAPKRLRIAGRDVGQRLAVEVDARPLQARR